MLELILGIIIGIAFIIIGIANTKGKINLMHKYHRKRVTEENKLPFGRLVGAGVIIVGVAIVVSTILNYFWEINGVKTLLTMATIVTIVGLGVGLILIFYAMIKYNKGIF